MENVSSHFDHIFTWSITCNAPTLTFKWKISQAYFIAIIKHRTESQSFSLTFSWELPVQKLGGRFPNTIELASGLVLCTV